jgi:hypothetical protein
MIGQREIIDCGEETRFYYIGGSVGNFASTYLPGYAYVPRDRYGYRLIRGYRNTDRRRMTGTVELAPQTLPDKPRIAVNVSHVTTQRTVRLELADETGRAIRGYSFTSCLPVRREGLMRTVRWKNNRTGRELGGRTVRIRTRLDSPDCGVVYTDSPRLYAIYTQDPA